jgi:hypothetical protein
MTQLTNGDFVPKSSGGGDRHTAGAKVDTARREEQIVALRLRRHTFAEIGRMLGVSKVAAYKGFMRALHRNADKDIKTFHAMELEDLELEQADIWKILDRPGNEENDHVRLQCYDRLNRVHIRRARLLGLDAPQRLDLRGLYRSGGEEMSAERLERPRILQALPVEEQIRIYEVFAEAKKRAAAFEMTATGDDGG